VRIFPTIAVVSAGLFGCHTQMQQTATAEDFGLYYSLSATEGAKLVHGRDGSDALDLLLTCAKGSGKIQLLDFANDGPHLRLVAGKAAEDLTGALKKGDDDYDWVEVAVTAASPAMKGFRSTGQIDLTSGSRRIVVAARTPPDLKAVADFFADCGTGA